MELDLRKFNKFVDKTFIEGAEKIAKHSEACLRAVAAGVDKPEPPTPTSFQKVKSANGDTHLGGLLAATTSGSASLNVRAADLLVVLHLGAAL